MLVLAMLIVPVSAFAAADTGSYSDAVGAKLSSGLTNTILGWTKIFSVPNDYRLAGKNAWAGFGKGLSDATVTTVGGAFNLITFPIPTNITLPDGGVNLNG